MNRYGLLPWPPGDEATPEQIARGQEFARSKVGKPYWPVEMACGCKLWPSGINPVLSVEPNPDCTVDSKFPWHGWKDAPEGDADE